MEHETLTMKELCTELRTSRPTIYRWIRDEGFPIICVNRKVLFARESVRAWLAEQEEAQRT